MRLTTSRAASALAVLVASAATAASAQAPKVRKDAPADAPAARAAAVARAINPANFDTTCSACTNFYRYANGGWLKTAVIPAAYSSWGTSNELAEKNEAVVRAVIEDAHRNLASAPKGSNAQRVGAFYASCMDTTAIEAAGAAPLKPTLDVIDAIRTVDDLKRAMGALERRGGLAPFSIGAGPDPKQASVIIASAGQGGLGLGDRDAYFRTDERSAQRREQYVAHVAKMLELAGTPASRAAEDARKVMALETRLAEASMSRVAMRDPNAVYNKMTLAELQALTPGFDWTQYLQQAGATGVTVVNVRQPGFFKAFDAMLAGVPLDDWKAYGRWRATNAAAPALSKAFVDQTFAWQRITTGVQEQQPRWKRCVAATNAALGEAVGQEYVKRAFTPEAKARALEMVNNLRDALRDRIGRLDWMSDSTKTQALAKLDAFTRKIGYPDQWRDYSALDVTSASYLENLRRVGTWSSARNWAKMGKPVDRTEWAMSPPTVNAYYSPLLNEIVFPAGILQVPYFDPTADDAVNYGAMGAVIGHELTHGFDDQGRQFDRQGNLRDWWTAADAERYKARAQLVVDQFDAYTVVDSTTRVNGKLTLGENIADLGGLTIAHEALQKALAKKGRPGNIDGFTPEQRFFLSWAQVWRRASRPEALRNQVLTDVHSPAEWRVNGPLANMPEFHRAFGCKEGHQMVRPANVRAQIW